MVHEPRRHVGRRKRCTVLCAHVLPADRHTARAAPPPLRTFAIYPFPPCLRLPLLLTPPPPGLNHNSTRTPKSPAMARSSRACPTSSSCSSRSRPRSTSSTTLTAILVPLAPRRPSSRSPVNTRCVLFFTRLVTRLTHLLLLILEQWCCQPLQASLCPPPAPHWLVRHPRRPVLNHQRLRTTLWRPSAAPTATAVPPAATTTPATPAAAARRWLCPVHDRAPRCRSPLDLCWPRTFFFFLLLSSLFSNLRLTTGRVPSNRGQPQGALC